VTATVSVGYHPIALAVDPTISTVYVVNEGTATANVPGQVPPTPGSVSVITGSGSRQQVTATITAGLGYPTSVAVDPSTHDVFVADDTSVAVIDGSRDANRDQVIATIDCGGTPSALAFDPSTHDLYVVDGGADTVSVFHTTHDPKYDTLIATIPVAYPGPIAIDPSTHAVYVASPRTVSVIDGSGDADADQVIATVPISGDAFSLAVDPSTHVVYVGGQHTVSVIDTAGNGRHDAVVATIGDLSGVAVPALAVDPYTHDVYAGPLEGGVVVIDGAPGVHRNQVVASIRDGYYGDQALALDPSTGDLYVAAFSYDTIEDVVAVISLPEADVGLTVTGPHRAANRSTFTEKVTVRNDGPDPAPSVSTDLSVPAGLSVTSAPGATGAAASRPLQWTDTAVAAGTSVTHLVTLTVAAHVHGTVALQGAALGSVDDPDPDNNAAITAIRLG
jgi:DNA-binding beta-propeller fold protein YncE